MSISVSLLADQSFECGQNKTPMERALLLLENMTKEFSLPQHECENVCTSLKEMVSDLSLSVFFSCTHE